MYIINLELYTYNENNKMQIITKKELNKGYIPSDKVTYRKISFESFNISYFLDRDKVMQQHKKALETSDWKLFINGIKNALAYSDKFIEISRQGYHTHYYININRDGIDCFISR